MILAVGLHYRSQWPDHQNTRSPLEFGWPCAEQCASLLSMTSRPLDVWIGWDALRMLDERNDLGVQVYLDADTSLMAPGRIRLRDRLMQIGA